MNPTANNRQYYAIRPLAKTTVSNLTVNIRTYESGKGWGGTAASTITGADIYALTHSFLQAIDTARLQPFPFDEEKQPDAANNDIIKLTAAKNKLATVIAESVAPLFQYLPDPVLLNAAVTAMQQLLQQSLYDGYSADIITVSAITGEARIYKDGQPINNTERTEDEAVDTASFPVVKRNCPMVTVPFDQTITALNDAAALPQQLRQFAYNSTFFYTEIETGTLYLGINFGTPQQSPTSIDTNSALLTGLVEFNANWDQLSADIPTADATVNGWTAIQRKALQVLAAMSETIADAWAPIITNVEDPSFTNAWQLSAVSGDTNGILLRLPVNAILPYKDWPDLFIDNEPLPKTILNENECLYTATQSISTPVKMQFYHLDLFTIAQVSTGTGIQHNRFDNSTLAVDPAFILTAPFVWTAPVQPALEYHHAIPLADGATAANFLVKLLEGLPGAMIAIKLRYQYDIAPGMPTTLPVTDLNLSFYTNELITALLTTAKEWLQFQQPEKGIFTAAITIRNEERELLQIEELQFEMAG